MLWRTSHHDLIRIAKDAPKVPPNDIRLYSLKRASDDLAELANQLGVKKLVLGGHDW